MANLKVCLLITKDDKLLLIKEKTGNSETHKWNIVKGTVDDEDIIQAVHREAMEEANVEVDLKGSIGVHVKYYGESKFTVYFSFIAEIAAGKPSVSNPDQQADGENISELKWFTKEELESLKEEDFVMDISYMLVKKYMEGVAFPLQVINSHNLKSS